MLDFQKITRMRSEKNMTQAEVCSIADLTVATLSRIENGHLDQISMGTLRKLAKVFKVKPAELLK